MQTLILRYAAFAVIATMANLATQRAIFHFGDSAIHIAAAIGAGTIVGLLIKYILDKQWIFFDQATGLRTHGKKFIIYTAMGVVTTAVFWGTETGFWLIWHSDLMREIGAIIGLAIGYSVKYNLDRRFVFTPGRSRAAA